jgi:uncharacterized membrane protein YeaQ/YmgE (transglycosylase-associated protein family)
MSETKRTPMLPSRSVHNWTIGHSLPPNVLALVGPQYVQAGRWLGLRNNTSNKTLGQRTLDEAYVMHLSNQSLLVILFVGIVAGWLAGRVMEGGGFGLIGDLIVGLIGAFIGDWLLPRLGIHLGSGIVAAIMNAFVGAVVLLLALRLVNGGFGYRRRWRGW